MLPDDFKGAAKPRSEIRIPLLAHRIGVDEDTIRAVLEVEARDRGFDSQGRPAMLFEPHVFYRQLSGAERSKAVEMGLAYRSWGERPYPRDSYPRLAQAVAINQEAALKSASWGASQVLGQNHETLGYVSATAMVASFCDNEDAHIEGMIRFILGAGLDAHLRRRDWTAFAAGYNGPGFRRNAYHTKLAQAYAKWANIPDIVWDPDEEDPEDLGLTPDEIVQIQRRLRELQYPEVGKADGKWGPRTRAAVLAFRADHGLPIYAGVDDTFWAALARSEGRPSLGVREFATVEDLREEGSQTIKEADKLGTVGKAVGGIGALAVVGEINEAFTESQNFLGLIMDRVSELPGIWSVALIGLAIFLLHERGVFQRIRLHDHTSGKNVGR